MTAARFSLLVLLALIAGPAIAQIQTIPPGGYRTGAAYHRHQPQPAGTDASFPDKRGLAVITVPHGTSSVKMRFDPDSLWGYVTAKGQSFRLYRRQEYRLDFADTLCIYSSNISINEGARVGDVMPTANHTPGQYLAMPNYYFSRGLTGFIFPLTVHYLREMYAASNPAFVTLLAKLQFNESLVDANKKNGLFRVTNIYREAAAKP